jgi:hypothetical protein
MVLTVPLALMGFTWTEDAERGTLLLRDGDRPVLRYNFGDELEAGVEPRYTRSCYVHPIHGLDGEILTGDFPSDHYHHRGLSWMWPAVQIGDEPRTHDLWHIRGIRQHFDGWIERRADSDSATLGARHDWKVGDRTVARETMRLVIHRADSRGRAIDVEVRIEAVDQPVHLRGAAERGYGGLCLRFGPREQTRITTDRGPLREDSILEWFDWVDLSARFGGGDATSGVAMFSHPDSRDHGSAWLLRHYGFLGTCWPGMESATIDAGASFTLRHRLYVHRGNATEGRVTEAFERYRASVVAATRPNLIWLMADDLGYGELGSYGQKLIQTPHLDRMASEGLRFTQFYAGATVCAPSRSVLMTGEHHGRTRVRGNAGRANPEAQALRPEDVTVARVLQEAGYATALIGKWGLGDIGPADTGLPRKHGIDLFFGYLNQRHAHNHFPDFLWHNEDRIAVPNVVTPVGGDGAGYATEARLFADDWFTDEALTFIAQHQDRPFFLYWNPRTMNEHASSGTARTCRITVPTR